MNASRCAATCSISGPSLQCQTRTPGPIWFRFSSISTRTRSGNIAACGRSISIGTYQYLCIPGNPYTSKQWTVERRAIPLHGIAQEDPTLDPLESRAYYHGSPRVETTQDGGTAEVRRESKPQCIRTVAQPILELVAKPLSVWRRGRLLPPQLPRQLPGRHRCRLVCCQCR